MQLFLDDGSLLFADAFAHTRVDPKGRIKNVPGLFASPLYPISVGGTPPVLVARGSYSYLSKRFDAASLAPSKAGPAGQVDFVLPDGRFLQAGQVVDARGQAPVTLAWPDDASGVTVRLGELGERRGIPMRVGGGRLARFHGVGHVRSVVCVHDLGVEGLPISRQVDVEVPHLGVLDAWPDREGLTVVAWEPRVCRATAVRLDDAGRELARVVVDAASLPVVDGDRVVSQPDAATVRSTPLRGGAATDVSIEAVSRAAGSRPKAPTRRDDVGIGLVVAGGGRTLLVPWHAETVLDLDRAVALDRKLPAKHAALRACITGWCRDHRAALLREGYERLCSVRESSGRVGLTFWRVPFHPENVKPASEALEPLVEAIDALGTYRVQGYGSQG